MSSCKKDPAAIRFGEDLKYYLYENAVQSPAWQMNQLPKFHRKFMGKAPLAMREDFSGTGKISCEWVKKSPKHRAVGVDLDPAPLDYAARVNVPVLRPDQRRRVSFLRQDVRKPTREKFDLIGAHNFSFFVFHEREELLQYAKAAYKSLRSQGTFFLELAGGEGFVTPNAVTEKVRVPKMGKVDYTWETHPFDPVTKIADYSIHFRLPGGRGMNDVFTYHWRLWEIREVREILLEAGFQETAVLWPKDETMTEYTTVESGEACEVWLAYVVGIKR